MIKYLTYCLIISIIVLAACERESDFDPLFPSQAILGTGSWEGDYWPTGEWKSCDPGEVGMDPDLLRKLNEDMVLQMRLHIDVHGLLVIRKGYVVAEQYYSEDYTRDSLHRVHSCTKSITSAAFGIAYDRGLISDLNQPLLDFFPEYQVENPEGKENITLRHALTMTDGLDWKELQYPYDDERNTFYQWRHQDGSMQFVLDRPLGDSAGQAFNYNSGISQLLAAVIEKQTSTRLDSFVNREIFQPLGIQNYNWLLNPDGVARGYSGVQLTARDLAKFGYLYLNEGSWEDRQLIPESWVHESTFRQVPRGDIPGFYYGFHWWAHESGYYAAVGYAGQLLIVVPKHELVVVFTNYHNTTEAFQNQTPFRLLETFIIPAVVDE